MKGNIMTSFVELKYLDTCLPDYFQGFNGHVYAVPLDNGDTYGDVLDCLLELINHEEIDGFEDNYNKIEMACEGMRFEAKENGYIDHVFNPFLDEGDREDTVYAYFGVVVE